MRTSVKIVLAALTAVAGWGAPSQADDSDYATASLVTISNKSNAGNGVTISIYDSKFAVMLTDCLPGRGIRTYNAPNAGDLIGGGQMSGICIRYQIFSSANRCQGSLLLDTLYGQEIQESGGAYPPQNVPAPPDPFVRH